MKFIAPPILWLNVGLLSLWFVDALRSPFSLWELPWAALLAVFVGGISLLIAAAGSTVLAVYLCQVDLHDRALHASTYFTQVIVPLRSIVLIYEAAWLKGNPIVVAYRDEGPDRRFIVFFPANSAGRFRSSQTVIELRALTAFARQGHGSD